MENLNLDNEIRKTDLQCFHDILGNQKNHLCIPAYQRPYSWERKQITDLMNDLYNSFEQERDWFFGTIFLSAEFNTDLSKNELLDGQQRITSLVLLLRCLYLFQHELGHDKFRFQGVVGRTEEEQEEEFNKILKANAQNKNSIKDCLFFTAYDEERNPITESRFLTGGELESDFKDFIKKTLDIDSTNYSNYKGLKNNNKPLENGPTVARINENLEIINEILLEFWDDDDKRSFKNFEDVLGFTKHILWNLKFVVVVLNKGKLVLEIFETINSRGKKLKLSDIIRFKTLRHYIDNDDELKKLTKSWGDIYLKINKFSNKEKSNYLSRFNFFNNLEIFLERFINSIADKNNQGGFTKDDDRIEFYTNRYANDLSEGTYEMLHILSCFEYFFLSSSHNFINSCPVRLRKQAVIVLDLLRISMKISDTSQIVLMSYFNNKFRFNYEKNEKNCLKIINELLEIFKSIYIISIVNRTEYKSNDTRNMYVKMAISQQKGEFKNAITYKNFKKIDFDGFPNRLEEKKAQIENIVFTTSSEMNYAKTTLKLYQFMDDFSKYPLPNLDEELEHLVPQRWEKIDEWKRSMSETNFDRALRESESEIKKVYLDTFSSLKENDGFFRMGNKYSFVNIIGNHLLLFGHHNTSLSNRYWLRTKNEKSGRIKEGKWELLKKLLNEDSNNFQLIPTSSDIMDTQSFNFSNIFELSTRYCQHIIENFDDFKID